MPDETKLTTEDGVVLMTEDGRPITTEATVGEAQVGSAILAADTSGALDTDGALDQ
jgi:hypothetical protein